MTPTERVAVWLYRRPRVRRAWKASCALWFAGGWALASAPTASAYVSPPSPLYSNSGRNIMAWSGLVDSYGVPVSDYFLSMVSPFEAGGAVLGNATQGFDSLNPVRWLIGILMAIVQAIMQIISYAPLQLEVALLLFIGVVGIWFLQFAISAPWLHWLAGVADPIVSTLQSMAVNLYVMPLGLLAATGYGGFIALTKARGRGLGIIAGSLGIMVAYFWFFNAPTQLVFSDNGLLGIGQYLGFVVAEGVTNNGPLVSGSPAAQLGSLISLLCTKFLREMVQLLNFGDVVDDVPGCAQLWNAAIMSGQTDAPVHAMGQCYPAAEYHAQTLGLDAAGWGLVMIIVEFVIMLCLAYIGFHVVGIGFRSFFRLLMLVIAVPLATAPGPPRRYAGRQVGIFFREGVEMFASTGGLSCVAILIGGVLSGGVQG